jgi:hypothetical protein
MEIRALPITTSLTADWLRPISVAILFGLSWYSSMSDFKTDTGFWTATLGINRLLEKYNFIYITIFEIIVQVQDATF